MIQYFDFFVYQTVGNNCVPPVKVMSRTASGETGAMSVHVFPDQAGTTLKAVNSAGHVTGGFHSSVDKKC